MNIRILPNCLVGAYRGYSNKVMSSGVTGHNEGASNISPFDAPSLCVPPCSEKRQASGFSSSSSGRAKASFVAQDDGVLQVDEVGVALLAFYQYEGVHHLDELAVCLVYGGARRFHRSHGAGGILVIALLDEGVHLLVCGGKLRHYFGQPEGGYVGGILALQVVAEINQQTRFLVELHLRVDAVVFDVLRQHLRRVGSRRHGKSGHALHRLAVAAVKRVAQVVGSCDVIGEEAFLRHFQRIVFAADVCFVRGDELRALLGEGLVRLDTCQGIGVEREMRPVVQSVQLDCVNLFHRLYCYNKVLCEYMTFFLFFQIVAEAAGVPFLSFRISGSFRGVPKRSFRLSRRRRESRFFLL